jgi:hypothetical protein
MTDRYTGTLDERVAPEDRPIRELLSDLWNNSQILIKEELKLATTELESKVDEAKADLMKAALGAGALYAGVLALVAALVLFLAKFVAPWVAALLVGVAVLGLGYALVRSGKKVNARSLTPERTVGSVREDVKTFREAVR